jgi:hypothetical protein
VSYALLKLSPAPVVFDGDKIVIDPGNNGYRVERDNCTVQVGAVERQAEHRTWSSGPANFQNMPREMVGGTGIEPVTPSMSTTCSTAELTAPGTCICDVTGGICDVCHPEKCCG